MVVRTVWQVRKPGKSRIMPLTERVSIGEEANLREKDEIILEWNSACKFQLVSE